MHHPIIMMWVAEERRRDLIRAAERYRRTGDGGRRAARTGRH